MTGEERPAAPEGERPEAQSRRSAGPVPLRSGALQSMVAEARLIAPAETPAAADD